MSKGTVEAIFVRPEKGQVYPVEKVKAIQGMGLEGDYYHKAVSENRRGLERELQITLIESESLEALARDYAIHLRPGESRRNIVTRGCPLNHLVGQEFQVGQVRLRGVSLCDPCLHLEELTQKGVMKALLHHGGLRAEILSEGLIEVGDFIEYSQENPCSSLTGKVRR